MWFDVKCEKCGTKNWLKIDNDISDSSGVDIEGIKCFNCGNIQYLGDKEDFEIMKEISGWETVEDCFWELGKEKPE